MTTLKELPRLPVPDLWLTVSRYLASLKAVLAPTDSLELLIKEHERQQLEAKIPLDVIKANWNKYEHVDKLVKQFMLNEGPQLQRDLKEYANKCQNWVSGLCGLFDCRKSRADIRPQLTSRLMWRRLI